MAGRLTVCSPAHPATCLRLQGAGMPDLIESLLDRGDGCQGGLVSHGHDPCWHITIDLAHPAYLASSQADGRQSPTTVQARNVQLNRLHGVLLARALVRVWYRYWTNSSMHRGVVTPGKASEKISTLSGPAKIRNAHPHANDALTAPAPLS